VNVGVATVGVGVATALHCASSLALIRSGLVIYILGEFIVAWHPSRHLSHSLSLFGVLVIVFGVSGLSTAIGQVVGG
jgi:hypothetical protein